MLIDCVYNTESRSAAHIIWEPTVTIKLEEDGATILEDKESVAERMRSESLKNVRNDIYPERKTADIIRTCATTREQSSHSERRSLEGLARGDRSLRRERVAFWSVGPS